MLPYDRPPLSKERLAGAMDDAALTLRPREWYAEQAVELRLAGSARSRSSPARVRIARGAALAVRPRADRDRRAAARRCPGPETSRTSTRSARRATPRRSATRLRPGVRLAIVGAGFVGQEVAATARSLGVDVTLIEAAPTPLHGPLGPQLGAWFADAAPRRGRRVPTGARIARFRRRAGGGCDGVVLADGHELACDALLVGIGVRPDTRWLASAGLPAAGLESTSAARPRCPACSRRATSRAATTGRPRSPRASPRRTACWASSRPRSPRPSFWSDQHGVRVQFAGDARGADAIELDGDPAARDFTALFLRDGVVRAGLLVGRPRALPALREQLDHPISDRRTA